MCDGVGKVLPSLASSQLSSPIDAKPPSKPQLQPRPLPIRTPKPPKHKPSRKSTKHFSWGEEKTITITTITIYLLSFPTSRFFQVQRQWNIMRVRRHIPNAFPMAKATDHHPPPHAEAQAPCSETPQYRTNPRSRSSNYTSSIRRRWQNENWRRDGRGSRRIR